MTRDYNASTKSWKVAETFASHLKHNFLFLWVLSLNRCSLETTLSENTINQVSNDAQKIEKSLNSLGYILSAPPEIVIDLV